MRSIAYAVALVGTVIAVLAAARIGSGHPHRTPEEMQARVQEIDAMLPVVKHSEAELRLERADLENRLQAMTEAIVECRGITLRHPDDPRPHSLIGQFCAQRNAFREAVGPLAEAARLGKDRELGLVLDMLGQCHMELGEPAQARSAYERAAKVARDDTGRATWLVKVAEAAEEAGDTGDALSVLSRACKLVKDWPRYWQLRAELLMRLGRHEDAAVDFAAAAKLCSGPDASYPLLVQVGLALSKAGLADRAKATLGSAVKTIDQLLAEEPAFAEDMYRWRGEAHFALGNHDLARKDAREALLGLPDADAYLKLMIAVGDAVGHDDETNNAKAVFADGAAREAKAKARFEESRARVATGVRASMAYAVEHVLVAAMCRRAGSDPVAIAKVRKRIDGLRPKAAKLADHPRCRLMLDLLAARIEVEAGDPAAAKAGIDLLAKDHVDDARVRRLRLEFARRTGDEKTAAADAKFLDELIKRADEPDLLLPPPAPPKEGSSRD